jgi:hypothetical protein
MARLDVPYRITRQLVIRESDGATLFLVAGYLGRRSVQPAMLAVIEPPDDE